MRTQHAVVTRALCLRLVASGYDAAMHDSACEEGADR